MLKFALFYLIIALFSSTNSLLAQEPKAVAYPNLKVYEYIESGHSAQYYLAQSEKPQKCMLYLKMKEGGIMYAIKSIKGKDRSKGFFSLDPQGNWQVEITHHAPGYGKMMCFAMDRMGQEADSLLILRLNKNESPFPCHRSCIDSCIEDQHQLEVQLDLARKPGKALKKQGFSSEAFKALYEGCKPIWIAYKSCRRRCF